MKIILLITFVAGFMLVSFTEKTGNTANPFFKDYNTQFGVPPFDKIQSEHYMPAFLRGIEEKRADIDRIVNSKEKPTFDNTIAALEKSGKLLDKVSYVFYNLSSAHTNDEIRKIEKEVAPLISKLNDDINLNEKLFSRIKSIYESKSNLNLSPEQARTLELYYKGFVRGGANLNDADKQKLRTINEKLSLLTIRFGENVLNETNEFQMFLTKEEELTGLPESVKAAAAEEATRAGKQGQWLFTVQKTSWIPFLQYSERRDLREKLLKAYVNMGGNDNKNDNRKILAEIAKLRVEKAKLLGYKTHADYVLEMNMAKTPDKVNELLNKLWVPALKNAVMEAEELQKMIDREGGNFKLQAWDWWYYAEKLRKEKYDLDEEELRQYFKLENVRDGAFLLANKLWGITFEERNDIPKYHPDVQTFEVKDADGSHIGVFLVDYHPRASKRGGAWMNAYRKQSKVDGINTPIVCNVCNFTKPTGDKPALLNFDEVTTLFHEFGHALHGLLSDCVYPTVSGTSVPRDFVELPSQIMENWAGEKEMLKLYARHYKTGELIPDELIQKIENSAKFNQGFVTTEYLAAAFLDMDWHTLTEPVELDADKFEEESLTKIGMINEIYVRYRSPSFRHIFSGGYSAGYYSYIWSGVLDADAFEAFKQKGLFDKETATKYREYILSKGGSADPMELYIKFRGAEPNIVPLLKRRGLD